MSRRKADVTAISFVEDLLAKAGPNQALVAQIGSSLYEVIEIRHGALVVALATDFKLGGGERIEVENVVMNNFWFVKK